MSEGGTHLLTALSRSGGLLSFRTFPSLLDVSEDFVPVPQIGGILYDLVISKASNHTLKNMSDLDLNYEIQLRGEGN